MRNPAFLLGIGILLGASAARAVPILVSLEDAGPGGIGPLSFSFDMDRQPHDPYDFGDAREFSGDYVLKEDPYRIMVADYFRVEMDGWTGYGYNWLLEVYPRAFGIYEEYCEIHFFSSPGQTLILQGAWTSYWSEDTPLYAGLRTDADPDVRFSEMRIAGLREAETAAVPEASSLALFGLGLGIMAGAVRLRRKR